MKNFNPTCFNNGDLIQVANSDNEWQEAAFDKMPMCIIKNGIRYYNKYVLDDPRGVCPAGYRYPTLNDQINIAANGNISEGGQINPSKIACFWLAENCTAGKNNDLILGLAIAIGYTKNPRTARLPRGMGCQLYFINH